MGMIRAAEKAYSLFFDGAKCWVGSLGPTQAWNDEEFIDIQAKKASTGAKRKTNYGGTRKLCSALKLVIGKLLHQEECNAAQ